MMMLGIAIGIGTEIIVGHLVGAGKLDEAYRQLLRSLRVGLGVTVITTCCVVALAPWLFGMFSSDPAIVVGGALLLRVSLLLEPGRTFNLVVINSLRATGDAFPGADGHVFDVGRGGTAGLAAGFASGLGPDRHLDRLHLRRMGAWPVDVRAGKAGSGKNTPAPSTPGSDLNSEIVFLWWSDPDFRRTSWA
ncbi:hypothetical protein LP420_00060 [Massilia sp. B-10]|nr:hypothetical protein LP420_00060 [Massilia sp. B-10]